MIRVLALIREELLGMKDNLKVRRKKVLEDNRIQGLEDLRLVPLGKELVVLLHEERKVHTMELVVEDHILQVLVQIPQ